MPDKPRRAAVYCRLSQDRSGVGLVVERQERECRDLARSLGWQVVEVFTDNDVSAYRAKRRPDYQRLLEAIRSGHVDAVLAWNTDRLHRSPKELESYIDLCQPRGVPTRTVRAGELDLTTASGRMVARQLGAVARYESEQTAGGTRAGKADAASRGAWAGGQRVYGYEVVPLAERESQGQALRVVPEERDVVQDAAQRVLVGESLRSIARGLNERGLRTTRGALWSGSALRKVLVRPVTAGLRASGGQVVAPGNWEPLLPEDQWRGVLAVLTDPSRKTTDRRERTYLGSGLYRCGVCGGTLTGNATAGGGSGGTRSRAYRCRVSDQAGSERTHVVRNADQLDAFIEAVVAARLARPDALHSLTPPQPDTAPMQLTAATLRARLDETARLWASGDLTTAMMTTASRELRQRLSEVEERIGQANRGTALDGILGAADVTDRWQELSLDRRRAVIDALITVTVHRTRRGRPPGWQPGESYFDPRGVEIEWRTS